MVRRTPGVAPGEDQLEEAVSAPETRRLARRRSTSGSASAVHELGELSRRADNAELLATLPDLDLDPDDVVDVLREGRAAR